MMYFRKIADTLGDFMDASGSRFSISAARRIRTSEGVNVGYVPFESLDAALAAWQLSPVEQEVLL